MTDPSLARLLVDASAGLAGDEARAEAEILLAHALGRDRSWLYAHADEACDAQSRARFEELLEQRRRGVPVAHLLGWREFWSLPLAVTADTLVPRPETECLVELALLRVAPGAPAEVLDLGTGSGAIVLALARERPQARLTAVDRDDRALDVAARNAQALGASRVEFLHGDWFAPVANRSFDLIVANPPYLAEDDPHLQRGDLRFEPRHALASGADGLDDLRAIIAQAPTHLRAGAWLLLEHGFEQGPAVRELLERSGLRDVASWPDLEGRDRVSGGRRPD